MSVVISTVLMIYKECNPNAFHFLVKYGVVIPPISDLQEKERIGFKAGAPAFVTSVLGQYSLKNLSLQM